MLSSLDEYISGNYKEETYYANLLSALTVFSVLITFSGVFSMLLYSLRLRRRSMAIRRVMGAGFRDVFRPQLRSYLLYVVAGGVLAYFPAALLMHKWMEYFHYGENAGRRTDGGHRYCVYAWWCRSSSMDEVRRCMNDKPVECNSAGIVKDITVFTFSDCPLYGCSAGTVFLCNSRGGCHRIFRAIRAHASASARHDGAASGRIRSGGLLFAVDGWASPGRMQDGSAGGCNGTSNRGTPCRRLGRRLSGILRQTDGCGGH